MNPLWDDDDLVDVLRHRTPSAIASGLAIVFDSSSLTEIANELAELARFLGRASSTSS